MVVVAKEVAVFYYLVCYVYYLPGSLHPQYERWLLVGLNIAWGAM